MRSGRSFSQLAIRPGEILPRRASITKFPSGRDSSRFTRRRAPRRNSKRRDLTATAGHIGEAGGAEAGEKTTELSAEQVRGEIHQHVAVIDLADVRDVRKNFAPDGDAFLGDPHTVLRRKRALDRRVPVSFTSFPAKGHARAAILIARLQDKVFALFTDKGEQIDALSVVCRPDVRDNSRPGNMLPDQFALAVGEERAILFVGKHGEKRLHMRNLAA